MIQIVRALRPEGKMVSPEDFYMLPEGERGYLFLERGAKVRAFMKGRENVIFSDFAALAFSILSHRIRFRYGSQENSEDQLSKELISRALEKVVENVAKGF
jgi:MoxR-like ATPase